MKLQTTPTLDIIDILALIEKKEEVIDNKEFFHMEDPLSQIENILIETTVQKPQESLLTRFRRASVPKIQFMFHYLSISTIVFIVLLMITNWNSYSAILSAYINPQTLTDSKNDIMTALDKSRVVVYADSSSYTPIKDEEKLNLMKKLEENDVDIKDDRFSVKQMIHEESKISINLDITPYDNRIIIPKIGKNIPLVDVRLSSGFDFDHMENIFMQELEKGVVRYP